MGLSTNLMWKINSNFISGNSAFKNCLFTILLVLDILIMATSAATTDIRESQFYQKNETSGNILHLNLKNNRTARSFFPGSGRNERAEQQPYSSELLRQIKSIDHMGCFPKVLCGLSVGVDSDKTFGLSKNTFVRSYLELMNDMKPHSVTENEKMSVRTQDEVEQELLWRFSPHNPDRKQEYSFEKVGSAANFESVEVEELEDDSHEYNSGDFDSRVAAEDSLMSMEKTERLGVASKLAGKIKRRKNRNNSITSKITSYFTSWLPEISVKTSGRKSSSASAVPSHVIESLRALVRKQEQQQQHELQRQLRTEGAGANDDIQTDGLNIYQTAVKVGKRLRDTKQCDYIYNGCPMEYNKILGMIRDIQTGNEPSIDEFQFDSPTTTTTTTKKPRVSTKHPNKVQIMSGLLVGSKNEDSDESSGSSAQPKETIEEDDDSHEPLRDEKENNRKEYLITKIDTIEPSDDEEDRTEVLKVEHHRHGPDPDKPSKVKGDSHSLSLQIPQLKLSGLKLSTSYSEEEPQSLEISHSSITMKQQPLSLDMSSLLLPNLGSSTVNKFPSTKTSSPYNGFPSSYAKLNDLLTNGGSVQGSLGSLFKTKSKESSSTTTTSNPGTATTATTERIILSGIQETLTFDTDEITDDTVQQLGSRDLVPVWISDDDSSASESGDSSTESDEEREILKNLNRLFLSPQNDVGGNAKKSKIQYKNPKKKNPPVKANSSSVRNKNRDSLKNRNFSGSGSQEMSSETDRVVIKHSSPTVYQSPLKGPGPHGGAYPYLAGIGRKPSVNHGYRFWRLKK